MRQIVRRTLPYSYLEPEALENFLEEQAREGLFLTDHTPVILPWHTFERRTPAPVRYRVQLSKKELTREARETAAAQGWRYLNRYGKANLFTTEDLYAPDLRRNWEDLAALRRESRRLYCNNLVLTCLLLLACFAYMVWSMGTGAVLDTLFTATAPYNPFSFWTGILSPLLVPFLVLFLFRGYWHLPKEADPPFQRNPAKLPPRFHKAVWFLRQGLGSVLILFLLIQPLLPDLPVYSPVNLSQSEWDALPYPLLQDLGGQAHADSMVFRGHHLLAPSLLEVRQYAEDEAYQLHIYHTQTPWVARWFSKGCISYFGHQDTAGDPIAHSDSLPPHNLDFAAYYTVTSPAGFPWSYTRHILILREGSTVIAVDYEGSFDILTLLPQFESVLKTA